jgi:glutamine amidotransferase
MKATIFDYGAGNLHSLAKALEREDVRVTIETDPVRATRTDVLVLPGVGAFGAAAERLAAGRAAMRSAIQEGLPTLGICLGMQLLFGESDEGDGAGLGVLAGRVTRLRSARVPQIGWNEVVSAGTDPLFVRAPLPIAYYANSYVCRPVDERTVTAWTEHEGDRFPAAVRVGNAVGVQFHPEKSSSDGVRFLHAFLDEVSMVRRRT